MVNAAQGDRYTAGCSKFPLPFTILAVNPVFPRITILDEFGTRIVRLSWLDSCIRAGCVSCKSHANFGYEVGTCKPAPTVVSYVNGGPHKASPKPAQNAPETGSTIMLNFIKMQNASGRYAIFQITGHKGRVYIDTSLFPGGVTPATLDVDGMVPAGEPTVAAGDPEKLAAKAAAEQAKAEKAQERARVQAEKLAARVAKTQAAAAAAVARAQKAAAAVAPAVQPEL